MKKILCTLFILLLAGNLYPFETEMKTLRMTDGEELITRLCLPEEPVQTIVVAVHGTGPHTYLNKRHESWSFYDVVAEGFCNQGLGFFTYNRRGVEMGEEPPMYHQIDSAKYLKYTPLAEAEDVESMIHALQADERFRSCQILLYGISEGTIIAPLVAQRARARVDGLLLHGYAHENMYDIIKWQNSGVGVTIMMNSFFDRNKDGAITPDEYENEEHPIPAYRKAFFQDLPFDSVDVVKDGRIDEKDFYVMRMKFDTLLMQKIEEGDDYWIRKNYVPITTPWFRGHFELEPNKTRMLRLDLPIHVFHGAMDANVPVETVYDLQQRFRVMRKTNLTIHVFEDHNHDLNFEQWLKDKTYSPGYQKIFEMASELDKSLFREE